MHLVTSPPQPRRLAVPKAPVLVMDGAGFLCLTLEGELKKMTATEARALVRDTMPVVCYAPMLARAMKIDSFHAYDALSLFAFVHPGKFTVPTPTGLARSLSLMEPETAEDQCLSLRDAVRHLLADLSSPGREEKTNAAAIAAMMGLGANDGNAGWTWTRAVLSTLGRDETPPQPGEIRAALRVWDKLDEWAMHAPEPAAGHHGIDPAETTERLHKMLHNQNKEERPAQKEYAAGLAAAFAPRHDSDTTAVVMAEAGTGVGKTLGYLAPATLWAEKNGGPVWISTYTRNLQRQVETELDRFYGDPVTKMRKVVTRKGRENYLCLLNMKDVAQSPSIFTNEQNAIALGLMLRWAAVTADGDLSGKDFPGWLSGLIGWHRTYSFADRRGECIYAACPHFDKCFVEKSIRKAKRADIVIANHALVMHQTAASGAEDRLPTRYIFDEGHHIFDAADSAFCAHLNGQETADLRRWLLGAETQGRSRARGIKRRLEDLMTGDDEAVRDIEALTDAARSLPGAAWRQRLIDGAPKGVTENFLSLCRQQVYARNKDRESFYSLETDVRPPVPGLFESAYALSLRLNDIRKPMLSLISHLKKRLEEETETLDSATRERIHFMINSLHRRATAVVGVWIDMLESLKAASSTAGFIDWLEIIRADGRDFDVGFYRYTLDPGAAFAASLKPHAQGAVITSATLRDISGEDKDGWQSPIARTGAGKLSGGSLQALHVASPFDYAAQTRILVVRDVRKEDTAEVAAAFRELFIAAKGGALGIFTSIQRLKSVHEKLLEPLQKSGLPLYAQHVDGLDNGTLIDIFREDENACLLGTDATRDGIDVPGRSLRLAIYDRVPWSRPTILHKARREYFGRGHDDMLTRFKIKQAYGRLIRRKEDKGVFVMLDSAMPTRLTTAFPENVAIERVGIAEAAAIVKDFLREPARD